MSAFVFQFWRIGFVRKDVIPGGWRKLFWRFYWLLPPSRPRRRTDEVTQLEIKVPNDLRVLHWSPDLTGLPYCGARGGAPWTTDFDTVSCEPCRTLGRPVVLQYRANTR